MGQREYGRTLFARRYYLRLCAGDHREVIGLDRTLAILLSLFFASSEWNFRIHHSQDMDPYNRKQGGAPIVLVSTTSPA